MRKNLNFKSLLKNLFLCLVILIPLVLSLAFGQMNNADDGSFGNGLNLLETIVFFAVTLVSFLISEFILFRLKLIQLNKGYILTIFIGLIFVIYNILVIYLTDFNSLMFFKNDGTSLIKIDDLDKIKSIFDSILMVFLALNFLINLPNFKNKDLFIRFVSFLIIIFTIIAIIYSLCNEFDKYKVCFENPNFFSKNISSVKSFFTYGNVFGHLLFICAIGITFLSLSYHNCFIFLFNFLFLPFVYVSGSRTCLIGFSLLFLCFFIFLIYKSYFKNKRLFISLISVSLILIILFLLELFVFKLIVIEEENTSYTLLDLILKVFTSYESRINIFGVMQEKFKTINYIFGVGYTLNDLVLRSYVNVGSYLFNYHNGYLEIFTTGGVFLSLIYVFIFVIVIRRVIKEFKVNRDLGLFFFIILIPYLVYQMSEAFPPLFNYFGGGALGFYLFAPSSYFNKEVFEFDFIKMKKK